MMYTVKQIAEMAGVTVRTLHYYDEIGLLPPAEVRRNGYRYYDDRSLFRLQQILFYREMDLSLEEIGAILDDPDFDVVNALHEQRAALTTEIERLQCLIGTIDRTIHHLSEGEPMSKQDLFKGFTKEEEQRRTAEAQERWGDEVAETAQRWNSYTDAQQQEIKAEGSAIYRDMVALIGTDPASDAVQAVIKRWHQHMRYFYEPSVERLRGLGQLYVDGPDFRAKFDQMHPDLAAFMQQAIEVYCDNQ